MKTYKIKASLTLDVEYEVEASDENDAVSSFIATASSSLQDIIEDGKIIDVTPDEYSAELVEADYKVLVSDINYDIETYDVYTADLDEDDPDFYDIVDDRIKELKAKLPSELTLELKYCRADNVEDMAIDQVSEETGFLVDFAKVTILEIN